MSIRNRRGHFSIAARFFEEEKNHAIDEIFSRVRIYRCELQYGTGCFEYSAISKDFAEVAEGNIAPYYSCICETQKDGSTKFVGFKQYDVLSDLPPVDCWSTSTPPP